jgi:hypothetical protein
MPIRYVKDIVVDPATVELMSKAFNDALERLRLSRTRPEQEPEWVREALALRIIETVQQRGERDPIRLREDALRHLAQAKPPSDTEEQGKRPPDR